MDYALEQRTVLVNLEVIWQLEGENITVLNDSEPAKHLYKGIHHRYDQNRQSWHMLLSVQEQERTKNQYASP